MWPRKARVIVRTFERIGRGTLSSVEELGRMWIVGAMGLLQLFLRPLRFGLIVQQMEFIGVQSLPIIILSSAFTGAVFTYETYGAFALFGAQGMVGGTVGVAVTRELGPTLTGLLVAGRAGSAMAAELGSMRVSEQIDALEAMAVDPMNYLVKPRLAASILVVPMLTLVFDLVGILGSYFVAIGTVGLSRPEFTVRLFDWMDGDDITAGVVKAVVFGAIIGVVCCYKGFYATGGAVGVGRATTSAVVVSSTAILVSNYFIALMLPSPV